MTLGSTIDSRKSKIGSIAICYSAFAILCALATANAQSGGDYTITKHVIASGGSSAMTDAGGVYQLAGTVGQKGTDVITDGGGIYVIHGGFWHAQGVPLDPPADIIWDADTLSPGRTTRSLVFSLEMPAIASASPGQDAIKVSLVDLQTPNPANNPSFPPPQFGCWEAGASCGTVIPAVVGPPAVAACTGTGETNGCARWVGKPSTFYETQGPPLTGPYRAARLQCTPFYWDWITETATDPIVVVGAEVVPSSEYSVRTYASSCKGVEGSCTNVSPAVTMYTRRSGDVDSEYNPPSATNQPNAIDVAQLVNKFKNAVGSPDHYRAQLQPNLPELNASVNALDIVAVVDATKSYAYPFSGPCPCPSTVTCGGTCAGCPGMCVKTCLGGDNDGEPCINNNHCPSGACAAVGTCRDSCGRCSP